MKHNVLCSSGDGAGKLFIFHC